MFLTRVCCVSLLFVAWVGLSTRLDSDAKNNSAEINKEK